MDVAAAGLAVASVAVLTALPAAVRAATTGALPGTAPLLRPNGPTVALAQAQVVAARRATRTRVRLVVARSHPVTLLASEGHVRDILYRYSFRD